MTVASFRAPGGFPSGLPLSPSFQATESPDDLAGRPSRLHTRPNDQPSVDTSVPWRHRNTPERRRWRHSDSIAQRSVCNFCARS